MNVSRARLGRSAKTVANNNLEGTSKPTNGSNSRNKSGANSKKPAVSKQKPKKLSRIPQRETPEIIEQIVSPRATRQKSPNKDKPVVKPMKTNKVASITDEEIEQLLSSNGSSVGSRKSARLKERLPSPAAAKKKPLVQSKLTNVTITAKPSTKKTAAPKGKLSPNKDTTKTPEHKLSPKKGKRASLNNQTLVVTKQPVWKSEPKPELLHCAPDDVYEFEYDATDVKQRKKKRTRAPRKPKQKKDRFILEEKNFKELKEDALLSPVANQKDITSTTPLLKSVAEKLSQLADPESNEFNPAEDSPNGEATSESASIIAGDLEEEPIAPEIDDSCFGFEETNIASPKKKQLTESTPLKQMPLAACFSSVSPVRKIGRKSCGRPARIDHDVALQMIRGIAPLKAAKKQTTTLKEFIEEVGDAENRKSKKQPPPTPPSAFVQPARRSYSRDALRAAKRVIIQPDEEAVSKPKRSTAGSNNKTKNNKKRDMELDEWAKTINSHFEDIENFDLSS